MNWTSVCCSLLLSLITVSGCYDSKRPSEPPVGTDFVEFVPVERLPTSELREVPGLLDKPDDMAGLVVVLYKYGVGFKCLDGRIFVEKHLGLDSHAPLDNKDFRANLTAKACAIGNDLRKAARMP